ncbi:MAG TPA: tryptophan 7-halogenase [Verrucomicrobiae bacterium]|nr:tryptophan 7-halogenase [Verrucomicrobiae bacterium]
MKTAPPAARYDVVIMGGALAGAATAILLLREKPALRILVIEKSSAFGRRVGEATVEISGYFLCRVLGLTQYLNESHLVKQGMRFWFSNDEAGNLEESSEIGGKYLSRVPAFQVDRSTLDEEVLQRAIALGAEICRPATVSRVRLNPGGDQHLEVRHLEQTHSVAARWVVDASGVAAVLARQQGWWRSNVEHPTTAVWARWTGVKDWDGFELSQKFPKWAMACNGIRATATNHLLGPGWWAWCIPLKGGDVSIGVVFDQRLVKWPESGSLGQRLKDFLSEHPVGAEILADASWREGDVLLRKNLPYSSTTIAGDGFALVGDAAGFLDPFYSPGMDWVSFTTWSTAKLILAEQEGKAVLPLVEKHNTAFTRCYQRWFEAVYKDKYEYMGDFELMRIVFQLDLGLYYLGIASQPFKRGACALSEPPFSTPPSVPFFHLMRFYNRRFAAMARERRRRSQWGRSNAHRRMLIPGFTFSGRSAWPVVKAMVAWATLELREGWRSWFARAAQRDITVPAAVAAEIVK